MKKKRIKSIKQKMIIVPMMIIMLFNFIFPSYSQADVFGVLASPLIGILTMLPDAINRLIFMTLETSKEDSQLAAAFGLGEYEIYVDKDDAQDILEPATGDPDAKIDTSEIIGDYNIPNIRITPAEIFANKIDMLNANFFDDEEATNDNGRSVVQTIKSTVSSWYQKLRLISIVGLLSVLVYIGIRIMISSTAADKAKYKERIKDWIVAMCLVFFLHYIMVFIMTSVDAITDTLSNTQNDKAEQINVAITNDGNIENQFYTNLTGYIRLCIEYRDILPKFSALIIYCALTFYTIYFVFIYLKRLLTLVLLTLIAPLVALTYPLDKLRDGKAQAFDYWLREYTINALLPVIHLILYTVLVSSAIDLVKRAPLYAVVAVAFIVPAEKIVKEMFGFKSSTAPGGGFAAGALASHVIGSLAKGDKAPKGGVPNKPGNKIPTFGDKGKIDSGYSDLAIGVGSGLTGHGQSNNGQSTTTGLNAFSPSSQMANLNAGQDEMHNWTTTGLDAFSPSSQMANLNAGQDEMHGWGLESIGNSLQGDGTGVSSLLAGASPLVAGAASITNGIGNGIAEATARGAREAFEGPRTIKNNAKNMVKKKFREAGGTKGVLSKVGKKGARGVIKTVSTVAGATYGLAAGMVSGDLNDMWKGLAGGAVAGKALGNKLANNAEDSMSNSRTRHTLDELRYGEVEADKMAMARAVKSDEKNIKYWENKNPIKRGESQSEYINRRNDDLERMSAYSDAADGDIKKMDKMYKIEKEMLAERGIPEKLEGYASDAEKQRFSEGKAGAQKYAEQIAKLSEQYSASDLRGEKQKDVIKSHTEKLMTSGLSRDEAEARAGKIVNQIKQYKGYV